MQRLVAWCIHRSAAVAVLAFLGLIAGGWLAARVPLDVFPEFVPVQVEIQTEAPGLAPEQVEQLVTRPVEAAVGGAPGLASMRSESSPGISVVSLSFADDADPYKARQGIAERIGEITASLPAGVGTPTLSPLVSSTMDLLKIGLVSEKLDPFALRERAQWVLRPALLAVPGVARITVYGGEEREIQIQPDTEKLAAYGFTLSDLADAARAALALRGAGYVEAREQRVLIQTPTPAPDPKVLADAVIGVRNNLPVTMGAVARVSEAAALKVGDALIQGKPGVLLSLSSQFGANTLATTRAVEAALAALTPGLKADGIEVYPAMHRPANFIERALGDIQVSLAIAAGLILAVLFLFLRNWRSALISFLAIPLSLVAAAVVLGRMGETLNTMTLGGFAVALGVLVDDAIIGIENVLRRLRLNAESPTPRPRLEVVRDATLEIRGPVLYATLVVLVAFVPVLVTSGVQGKFVGPLAIAFMVSVVASLAVALTVTPALSALLLDAHAAGGEAGWIAALKARQAALIGAVDRRLPLVGGVLLALFLLAAAGTRFLSGQFMPDFREGSFVIQVNSAVPGTSLADMEAVGRRISRELLAMPEVATAEQQLGRSQGGEDVFGTERSEFHVELKRDASGNQAAVQDRLRKLMQGYPGINAEVVTFLGDRVSESLTGETAAEVVNIYGDDLEAIDRAATAIGDTLEKVEGVADLQVQHDAETPAMMVELDPEALAAHGLKAQDALETLHTAYAGAVVGETYAGARKVDVVLILPEYQRRRIEQIAALRVSGPFGPVPLGEVAHVAPSQGRFTIKHEEGRRRVSVTFNVKGRNLNAVVDDAKAKVAAAVKPEPGVTWQFTGQAEAGAAGAAELVLYTGVALVLIVMLLFLAFTRASHPWLVLVNLPFSLIGSIFIIAVTGVGLSLGTLVGLATVFGIGARNAILLLAHYEHLVESEGMPWNDETVLRGAAERLVPILMTAAVTALGLAPLAFGLNAPGQEVQGPMAVSVLGGLVTSTALNLIVLPTLARRFSYRK
ncbi:MAG: efflux RND transporter permease subunit [Rhodospirillaceae bacterium]|nr:efflux RND transporter permease subunit [Rhodospirillaceae bacterium]